MSSEAGTKARDKAASPALLAYRRHRIDLFNYFRRCGLPRYAAEELTQSVFVVLLEDPQRFDPNRGALRGFLFGVARNLRRAWSRQRRSAVEAAAAAPEVEGDLARSEEVLAVRQGVLALPDEQREALVLREFHGATYAEIARIQGIPVGTVRSRLFHARDELRRRLRGRSAGSEERP